MLVGPLYAGNVGAVARVATNFDCADVRVVTPACDVRSPEAYRYGKGPATATLDAIRIEESLAAALADCELAVAFTRRTGATRRPSVRVGGLAALASGARTAFVFGREDAGLTAAELAACTHVCTFATGKAMPSLNLSHAVAVALAHLFESASGAASAGAADLAPLGEVSTLLAHWKRTVAAIGLEEGGRGERLLEKLRPVLQRAALTKTELAAFRAFLSKTEVALGTRVNQRRKAR
ncbi:MAG: RNA methyltransferase [Deltaproteobacteria bacterium]|nr:RNA methyltransferase [Deltaproteobacteria bacterium]